VHDTHSCKTVRERNEQSRTDIPKLHYRQNNCSHHEQQISNVNLMLSEKMPVIQISARNVSIKQKV